VSAASGERQRFSVGRRWLAIATTLNGFVALGLAAYYLVRDEPWYLAPFWVFFALTQLALGLVHGRQHVTLTSDELTITYLLRARRVPWTDVERIVLDWAAAAAGKDREAFRLDRRSGPQERSAGVMGLLGDRADELEAALHQRADEHGFEVEVHHPSWTGR
jgi:hypothetical protein